MTEGCQPHRSFVSYIDKSREYYAASGYDKAYEWAYNDDAPFTPLLKPLSASKVGLGRIGSVSDRVYCLPTQYSHRQTQRRASARHSRTILCSPHNRASTRRQ
ncbi:MAG: hypothetical protein ACI8TP_000403 [Acidimicrobiales bacterium]|jgi:hypothetical protein